jgi:hypothetical protein
MFVNSTKGVCRTIGVQQKTVGSLVSVQGGNPYRIQMNVAVDLQRFCWLVEDGFETSLKQWSDSTVFSIEPHAVADIKPMDRFAKVRLYRPVLLIDEARQMSASAFTELRLLFQRRVRFPLHPPHRASQR